MIHQIVSFHNTGGVDLGFGRVDGGSAPVLVESLLSSYFVGFQLSSMLKKARNNAKNISKKDE